MRKLRNVDRMSEIFAKSFSYSDKPDPGLSSLLAIPLNQIRVLPELLLGCGDRIPPIHVLRAGDNPPRYFCFNNRSTTDATYPLAES